MHRISSGHFFYLIVTGNRKTFILIMAVTLKFKDMFDEGHIEMKTINYPDNGHILFDILDEVEGNECCIAFDKKTAIKFSKELRKQIALLD